jgi:hypothetical protein
MKDFNSFQSKTNNCLKTTPISPIMSQIREKLKVENLR